MVQRLIVIGDIHGDYYVLHTLLEHVTKIAKYNDTKWIWNPKKVGYTVVILGDFLDRFRKNCFPNITTTEAIRDEKKIIETFIELRHQAKKYNSEFLPLSGNHELGNITQYNWYSQIAHPYSKQERIERAKFIRKIVKPFIKTLPVVIRWGSLLLCHGGLEYKWIKKHDIKSIKQINLLWKTGNYKIFQERDSPLMSRKVAMEPDDWRANDKPFIQQLLTNDEEIQVVVGHTLVNEIRGISGSVGIPQCDRDTKSKPTMLASSDFDGRDDIYYVDVAMSDAFDNLHVGDRTMRLPQAIAFQVRNFRNTKRTCEQTCKLLTLSRDKIERYVSKLKL